MQTDTQQTKNLPIGVFDSGIGGLTVAREIMKQMPDERIVYFGDTARVQYGNKSKETVTKFSEQIVRFLIRQNVKAIAVACNTASAQAFPALRESCPVPILGVIEAGADSAAAATGNKKIGVIGTASTIASEAYQKAIMSRIPDAEVIGRSCPLFVPLVEEGLWEDPVTDEIARRYLEELCNRGIDTLILGCTHYPLIRGTIARTMGDGVKLVDPAYETARELKNLLAQRDMLADGRPALGEGGQYEFYVSDMAEKFKAFANMIIRYGILSARTVDIEKY